MTTRSQLPAGPTEDKFYLGGLAFGGSVIMSTEQELVVELPCGLFIRIKK